MASASLAVARTAGAGGRFFGEGQAKANAPYGLPIIEDMREFEHGENSFFAGLDDQTLEDLNRIQHSSSYPSGAVVLWRGRRHEAFTSCARAGLK